MANTKKIEITGSAPFDLYDHKPLQPMLAFIAGPVSGMKLEWTGQLGSVPNEHGGKTAVFAFKLTGREAVSWAWIDAFKKEIDAIGGRIGDDNTRDIEGM